MSKIQYNCPNCGAPRKNGEIRCEYCGTEFNIRAIIPRCNKVQKIQLQIGEDFVEFDGYITSKIEERFMVAEYKTVSGPDGRLERQVNPHTARKITLEIISV